MLRETARETERCAQSRSKGQGPMSRAPGNRKSQQVSELRSDMARLRCFKDSLKEVRRVDGDGHKQHGETQTV